MNTRSYGDNATLQDKNYICNVINFMNSILPENRVISSGGEILRYSETSTSYSQQPAHVPWPEPDNLIQTPTLQFLNIHFNIMPQPTPNLCHKVSPNFPHATCPTSDTPYIKIFAWQLTTMSADCGNALTPCQQRFLQKCRGNGAEIWYGAPVTWDRLDMQNQQEASKQNRIGSTHGRHITEYERRLGNANWGT